MHQMCAFDHSLHSISGALNPFSPLEKSLLPYILFFLVLHPDDLHAIFFLCLFQPPVYTSYFTHIHTIPRFDAIVEQITAA